MLTLLKDISIKVVAFSILFGLMSGSAVAVPSSNQSPKATETAAKQDLQDITGFWYTEGHEGGVQIYPCGDKICGRLAWLNDPPDAEVSRDDRNPDPELRQRPLCHLQFIGGFTPAGDHHFTDGWIYSPRHGADFSAHITVIDHNHIKLRGYLLVPALGESQIWTRDDNMPSCKDQ